MKKTPIKKIWVAEDFAKQCKIMAAKENKSMIKLTEELSKSLGDDNDSEKPKKFKGFGWSI